MACANTAAAAPALPSFATLCTPAFPDPSAEIWAAVVLPPPVDGGATLPPDAGTTSEYSLLPALPGGA